MLSVNRVIKFLWVISLILFLAGLLYGYYILPDAICFKFDSYGFPMDYMPRKNAFYIFTGICGSYNILIILIEKLILMIPNRLKPVLNKIYWLSTQETQNGLNFVLSNWFYSFLVILNVCLFVVFYAFAKVNSNFQSNIIQYFWVFQAITIILVLWILYLPVRLFISKIFIK